MSYLSIILVVLFLSKAMAASLVTVIGTNMSAPWLIYGKNNDPEGITVDYLRLLEKRLKRPVEIQILPKPRIRIAFEKGEIDFNCFTSPLWAGKESANFLWSESLFQVKSILVTNDKPVDSIQSILGQRVGTVRKYKYPHLKELFSSGKLIRDDASDEYANMIKLELDRFKYAVAEINHFKYYLAQNPGSKLKYTGISLFETDVRCWVRKGSSLKLSHLNRAIVEIKSDGSLDEVFQKYFTKKEDLKVSQL